MIPRSPAEREARIAILMGQGLDRPEAEMVWAMEQGENTWGDTPIEMPDGTLRGDEEPDPKPAPRPPSDRFVQPENGIEIVKKAPTAEEP